MGRVYGLKHATPKMKYQHMLMVMDWKADLKEQQAAYALRQLNETQAELMCELMGLDLAWEAWFDDNDNVPEYGSINGRIEILKLRIAALKVFQPLALRQE